MPVNRSKSEAKTLSNAICFLQFSFLPNGSSAVAQSSIRGEGITSVTRASAGVFDVVFQDPIKEAEIQGFLPSLQLAAGADTEVQSWLWTDATKTLRVRINTAGVAADIASDANNRIGGVLVVKSGGAGK